MTELVPTDCEEFEWVDEVANHWDVPEPKDYDRHGYYLVYPKQRAWKRGSNQGGKRFWFLVL